jgi:hypothetical protein
MSGKKLCYLTKFKILPMKSKEIFIILNRNLDHECVRKLRDLSTTHDIIHGGCGKQLSGFYNFIMYDAYKWEHLRRRIRESRRMQLGFESGHQIWF